MIRSMYAGVTGMKNHQTRMDTLSNNIANVNTTGFKSARANFQDTLYQTIRSEGEGRNASQVGLGMQVGSISVNFTQGPMLYTGRTLDLGIDGEGFFIVKDSSGGDHYTRDGVFYVDNRGYLVTGEGYNVQTRNGSDIRIGNGNIAIAELSIGPNGEIIAKDTEGDEMNVNGSIGLATFSNKEGLKRVGKNLYIETDASGRPDEGEANTGGFGAINSGYLEGSNVELTEEFTNMITTQRGYQASARVITTSDHLLEELINLKR